MIQSCQVYINIDCNSNKNKREVSHALKKYFSKSSNLMIDRNKIWELEIVDDTDTLIVIDMSIDIKCNFVAGRRGSRLNPPEPAYIENFYTSDDFKDWIKKVIPIELKEKINSIEIDDDSFIPSEDNLLGGMIDEEY